LSWNLPDGAATDFVQVTVMDGGSVVFATPPEIGAAGALNGTSRSVAIPASAFAPGKFYTGMIRVVRPSTVDTFSYPTAVGMAGHARVTRFVMHTASGVPQQPMLEMPVRIENQTGLTFSSVRGEKYVIHSAMELPEWVAGATVTATGPTTTVRLPANSAPMWFYRVVVAP
jgi:hypothetical protein